LKTTSNTSNGQDFTGSKTGTY